MKNRTWFAINHANAFDDEVVVIEVRSDGSTVVRNIEPKDVDMGSPEFKEE